MPPPLATAQRWCDDEVLAAPTALAGMLTPRRVPTALEVVELEGRCTRLAETLDPFLSRPPAERTSR
jgi:hypothetical protein